jgi:hypothetical protein
MNFSDIRPEDLFLSRGDHVVINHDLIRHYGLFNLSPELQNEVLNTYLANASKKGERAQFRVRTFMDLSRNIQNFPFPVIANFTSGQAYEYNMTWLEDFAAS